MITRVAKPIKTANLNIRVPEKLKKQFVAMCEEQDIKYSKVMRDLIQEYVNTPIKDIELQKRNEYLQTQRLL